MRLIDAEKLRAEYLGMPNCYNGFSDSYDKAMIVDMVDEQPTVDAVPVVRCKECKYMEYMSTCTRNGIRISRVPNDYCSRGKKREVKNE